MRNSRNVSWDPKTHTSSPRNRSALSVADHPLASTSSQHTVAAALRSSDEENNLEEHGQGRKAMAYMKRKRTNAMAKLRRENEEQELPPVNKRLRHEVRNCRYLRLYQ